MDLLMCAEEMLPETPEGAYHVGPSSVPDQNFDYSMDTMPSAFEDKNLMEDVRVLPDMLIMEKKLQTQVKADYFVSIQKEVTPATRCQLIAWMFEVCEEEHWMECVFLRAVSYVDRVLSVNRILMNQLQLLGLTSLVLSLKWSGVNYNINRLLFYTHGSVPLELLTEWEIMIVYAIKWDLATIVPSDFIQQYLPRLPRNIWDSSTLEKVKTYTAFCATETSFLVYTPSVIAAAALGMAISCRFGPEVVKDAVKKIQEFTETDAELIHAVMAKIQVATNNCVVENSKCPGATDPGNNNKNNNNSLSQHVNPIIVV